MKRALVIVLALVVVAGAAALYLLTANLDRIVARVIEDVGTELTGTRVRVASVSLDLRQGRGTVRGLRVANPAGFSRGDAFRLGEITLEIDPASLTRSPVVLPVVQVAEPEVFFELNDAGKGNVNEIRRHLEGPGAAASGDATQPAGRYAIRRLVVEKGVIRADTRAVGGDQRELALPSVRLTHVGGNRGATPEEIGRTLLVALTGRVAGTVARSELESYLADKIDASLGEASEAAKSALRSIFGTGEP